MKKLLSIILLLCATLTACNKSEYSNHYCYFVYNGTLHPASQLVTAYTGYENWAIVTTNTLSGASYSVVTQLYGQGTKTENITTATETNAGHTLGLANGLIIGRSTLNADEVYAYDRQCPNCYNSTGLTVAALVWGDDSHTVKCPKCDRHYNLSGSGVVSSGTGGDNLMRYRVTVSGDVLIVRN